MAVMQEVAPNWRTQVRSAAAQNPEAVLTAVLLTCLVIPGASGPVSIAIIAVAIFFAARVLSLYLGNAALMMNRYQLADICLRAGLWLNPFSIDALKFSGALLLLRGDAAGAERLLRRALVLSDHQPSLSAALSGALLDQGRLREAAAEARRAIKLDAKNPVAFLHLAQAERGINSDPLQIEAHLRAGLVADPQPHIEATLRCALADHLIGQRREAEAQLTIRSVEALLPRCAVSHRALLRTRVAELRWSLGETEVADAHVAQAEP